MLSYLFVFCLRIRLPQRSTRTYTLFPYPPLFRSHRRHDGASGAALPAVERVAAGAVRPADARFPGGGPGTDRAGQALRRGCGGAAPGAQPQPRSDDRHAGAAAPGTPPHLGRPPCRERCCTYVYILVVAFSTKTTKTTILF